MRKHIASAVAFSKKKAVALSLALSLFAMDGQAQLSSNPDKFLGNITTRYNVDYGKEPFYTLWNQITPENESKWESIEGSARGSFNWQSDAAYNYAKQHNFPFKFHTFIWGGQYPSWMDNLSTAEQYKAIVEWLDAIKKHYPTIDLIDVVNEAIPGHAPAPYKDALGGDGVTGYDWIVKAFELAYERWPDAILIYNDYNTFEWQKSQFIDLVKKVRDAGAPIDAYGCQSHDLTGMDVSKFKSAMTEIQNSLKMPMYSTEYDIGTTDDDLQLQRYKEQIPYMWESSYCAGITLWGYIYGATWTTDGNSGIIRDGKDRPAMTWLRQYMQTDAAKKAKSPFPGMKKEASVYVKPAAPKVPLGDNVPITVRARMRTKTIEKVELYVKGQLYETMTEAPYVSHYTSIATGTHSLKAIVYTTDGEKYERVGSFIVGSRRAVHQGGGELPGTVECENFDGGQEGIVYHDTDNRNTGNAKSYRTNGGGVDIVNTGDGYGLGETMAGEWVEYTVDVLEEGLYSFEALASAGAYGASFNLALSNYSEQTPLTDNITVPCPKLGDFSNYQTIYGRMLVPLQKGKQVIRLNVTGGQCNFDRITFSRVDVNENMKVSVSASPVTPTVGSSVTVKSSANNGGEGIKCIRLYANGVLFATLTEAPYQAEYVPDMKGLCYITAIAEDMDGNESKIATTRISVKNVQKPFGDMVSLPGVIEAENFDEGGETLSFHDTDKVDEGGTKYRSDNEGLDIVTGNGGYAIGYTAANEWTEYTVNVTDPGKYEFEATVSSGVTGSSFRICLVKNSTIMTLATVTVPQTGSSNWDTYKVVKGVLSRNLEEGEQVLRLVISGAQCNIDKIKFNCTESTGINGVMADTPANSEPVIYNLSGQRLNSLQKGINIVNGKKVLVK